MQGKSAKRVGDGEEQQAVPAEHRAYRAEDFDPVFFSFNMGKHAEERYSEVIRTCCPGGIEIGGDQQTLAADAGCCGLRLQRPAGVS
jgi:hypothetical protein